jgi:phosphoribosylformylglycinamidine synthase
MFERVFNDPQKFVLGVCNGAQLMPLLSLVPFRGLPEISQPRFIYNTSGVFGCRWVQVKILANDCVLLDGMAGLTSGVYVAHGEGRAYFPDPGVLQQTLDQGHAPIVYVDSNNEPTNRFPWNPNGSQNGIAALCTKNHLAMMPHGPDRGFLPWQHGYWPSEWSDIKVSPWFKILQNGTKFLKKNR